MLAIVSWSSASKSPLLVACLLVGAASILGMFCRGLTYEIEKRPGDKWQIPLSWSWRPTNSPRMFDGANGVGIESKEPDSRRRVSKGPPSFSGYLSA
jgi:hypothetical protein